MVGRPARRPDRTTAVNSGRRRRRACAGNTSGGELLATLAPATGDDRATGAGAHPQPEAVGLGPATVVRLERALAHEVLLLHDIGGRVPAGRGPRWGHWPRKLGSCENDRQAGEDLRRAAALSQTSTSIAEDHRAPAAARSAGIPGSAARPGRASRHAVLTAGATTADAPGTLTGRCRAVDEA